MSRLALVGNATNHGVLLAVASCIAAMSLAMVLHYPERSASFWRDVGAALRRFIRWSSMIGATVRIALRRRSTDWWFATRPTRVRPWPTMTLIGVLVAPTVTVLFWRGDSDRMFFDRSATYTASPSGAVAALLRGEHLSPPAALPPALFATPDVDRVRPRLAYASRAWDLLDDAFAQQLLRLYQLMKDRHGYEMVLIEGYRSPERQNELAALGSHVTAAAAFQSYHQYGLAADSAFLRDGKLVISEADPWAMQGYRLFGALAAELGLTWGGEWKLRDFGHVEWRRRKVRQNVSNFSESS